MNIPVIVRVIPNKPKKGDVAKLMFLVKHPMDPGTIKDPKTGKLIPANYITTIHISYIELTPLSGKAFFQVPIRMAQSSYVRGIALLKNGSLIGDFKFTKVTVGGCG